MESEIWMMNIGRKIQDFRKSKLLKGSAGFFVMKIGAMFIGYVNIWIISRFFGAEALGLFSFVLAASSLAVVFAKVGIGTATVKFISRLLAKKAYGKILSYYKQIVKIILPGIFLVALLLFFGDKEIANYIFNKPHYAYYLRISALLIFPVSFTQINAQVFRAFEKIIAYAFFNLYTTSITLIVLLVVILTDASRHEAVPISVHAYSSAFMLVLSFVFLLILFLPLRKFTNETISAKEITKVSFPMYHVAIALVVVNWADKLLLGAFVSDYQIGVYHVMHRMAAILGLFLISANTVLAPRFSELWEKGQVREIHTLVHRSTRLLTLTALPVLALMVLFAEELAALFGSDFTEGSSVLIILALGKFLAVWSGPGGVFLLMTGQERFTRNVSIISTICFLIVAYFAISFWGIIGAAIAVSLVQIFRNLIFVIYIKRKLGFNFLYIPFLKR